MPVKARFDTGILSAVHPAGQTDFVLFGVAHCLILAMVVALAAALSRVIRRWPSSATPVRLGLGVFLIVNELIWYLFKLGHEGLRFPEGLPLQLCDLALWVTAIAALTRIQAIYEFSYFIGLTGPVLALLTPDLWAPTLSYPTIYFFLAHGMLVVTVLTVTWSGIARPRPGSVMRSFAWLNCWAALVALFNAVFHTNYMYLCRKPPSASLLDFLGPWPVYVIAGQLLALGFFVLLWLPFRSRRAGSLAPA